MRTIDTQWRERLRARMASCADVGGTLDFALMVLDRFMQPDDPETQLAAGQDIGDDATAIADLRQLADQTDSENARHALGIRLMESRDPASQAEGRALLEQRAPNDANVVSFLAGCFSAGCGFFRGDPGVAVAWLEQAAGLGEWWALNTQIMDLQTAGQTTDVWSWALYRLDLAEAGRFETGQPQTFFIGQSAQTAFQLEGTLNADQQAAGRAAERVIAAHWLAHAEIAQACAG